MLAARLRTLLVEQGLAALQTAMKQQAAHLPPEQYARLERIIAGVDTSPPHAAPAEAIGTVTVNDGSVHGQVVGLNQGIIQGTYNRIERLGTLIRGDQIAGDNIAGDKVLGNTTQIDQLTLVIYTGPAQPLDDPEARRSLEQAYRSELVARYAIWRSRYALLPMETEVQPKSRDNEHPFLERDEFIFQVLGARLAPPQETLVDLDDEPVFDKEIDTFTDLREGLQRYHDLLLLGSPGGGKTTALWRLALDLAEDGLYRDSDAPLPIFVRLGGITRQETVIDLLRRELSHATLYDQRKRPLRLPAHRQLVALLPSLLADCRVVLLWDGLNETPRDLFATTARAIDQFRTQYLPTIHARNRSVTTCRVEDFAALGADSASSTPFTMQQVTLRDLDQTTAEALIRGHLGPAQGTQLLTALAQPQQQRLRSLVRTPLLLTMLCEVYARWHTIPPNRGKVLEAFVETRWDWERQRHPERWINDRRQRTILARLAYVMTSNHGRGTSVPWNWARHIVQHVDDTVDPGHFRSLAQAADILELTDEGQSIRFSHQLLQEYFAALALADELAFLEQPHLHHTRRWQQHKSSWQKKLARYVAVGKRTGWEETIFLLASLRENVTYLQDLKAYWLSRPLELAQLLEAEASDTSLREDIQTAALQQIGDSDLAFEQRIDAGFALGLLGDPRFPVSMAEWQQEVMRRSERFGQPVGYWCYVRPGTYRIGGWEENQASTNVNLPSFWIARFPITVAQYAPFVAAGYNLDAKRWWTPNGWQWKDDRVQPWRWNKSPYDGANQPVIGVTWYEATAFCAWMTEQVQDDLPDGYRIRLPTEAEWETAAAYDVQRQRQPYPWGDAEPTAEYAIFEDDQGSNLGRPAPVGCCPAGAAACGALDMAGTVWELTTSSHAAYPAQSGTGKEDFTPDEWDMPWRGGSWYRDSAYVRCGARGRYAPCNVYHEDGFRVVLAPSPATAGSAA